jgi:hypothetical protein
VLNTILEKSSSFWAALFALRLYSRSSLFGTPKWIKRIPARCLRRIGKLKSRGSNDAEHQIYVASAKV